MRASSVLNLEQNIIYSFNFEYLSVLLLFYKGAVNNAL